LPATGGAHLANSGFGQRFIVKFDDLGLDATANIAN